MNGCPRRIVNHLQTITLALSLRPFRRRAESAICIGAAGSSALLAMTSIEGQQTKGVLFNQNGPQLNLRWVLMMSSRRPPARRPGVPLPTGSGRESLAGLGSGATRSTGPPKGYNH